MDKNNKIILVTGSNRGIGYGIIEGLLEKKSNFSFILTSRSEEEANKSKNKLLSKFPNANIFTHQLDLSDQKSIDNLVKYVQTTFNKIDILIDNAGSNYNKSNAYENYLKIFAVNVFGTIDITEKFIENNLIKNKGKIIILSSQMGYSSQVSNETLKNKILNVKTKDEILKFAEQFGNSIKNKTNEGWGNGIYGISKLLIKMYAKVVSEYDIINKNEIGVYSVHPGWVKTDMGGTGAPLSIKEGASREIMLVELPEGIDKKYQGKYFQDFKVANY